MTTEPVPVNLFEWIGERMIQEIEEQPITVDVRLADGTITMEVPRKHPWHKELSRRKAEQVSRLRASLKAKLSSTNPNPRETYDNNKQPVGREQHHRSQS